MHAEFYQSKRWKRKRAAILRRDGYICRLSKRYGKTVEATVVHHIFPLEDYPEYALCEWNLISLSAKQHDMLHDRRTGVLTAKGMELLRRTARAQGIPPP